MFMAHRGLQSMQKQVLMSGIWRPRRQEGIEVVEQGTWLPTELRAKLAVEVVGDWDDDPGKRWATKDPAAAGGWVLRLPPGELRSQAGEAVAAEWVKYAEADLHAWAHRMNRR
jgi:hypothetical protein